MQTTASSKKAGRGNSLVLMAVLLAMSVAVTAIALSSCESASKGTDPAAQADQSLRRGENRATLDPTLFSNPKIRESYQVAKDIPWVLDSIYCYCFCEENFGHKSLLSCYVDNHAAN